MATLVIAHCIVENILDYNSSHSYWPDEDTFMKKKTGK